MFFSKLSLTTSGFSQKDVVHIKADSLFEAAKILGEKTSELTIKTLGMRLKEKSRDKALDQSQKELDLLEKLRKDGSLKIGSVNYVSRYLETVTGFAEGAGISIVECLFLQKEIESGCQTIIKQNENGDITFLFTEEDDSGENTAPHYDYRLVNVNFAGRQATFFAYPGVCFWGPAFGIDKTNKYAQMANDLVLHEKFGGALWPNLVSAMLFDCANVKKANILLDKLSKVARRTGFTNGYAVHMIQNTEKPHHLSCEFGGKSVKKTTSIGECLVQVNYPRDKYLQQFSDSNPPKNLKKWNDSQKMTHYEMQRRGQRLKSICNMDWWNVKTPSDTIKTGLKVLAYPYGDLRRYKDKKGKWMYYHTGLPSLWTFAHFIGHMGKVNKFYIGKNTPKPISNMEYSNKIDNNYKYQEEKLWEYIKTK